MSRSPEQQLPGRAVGSRTRADAGFTLVEVIVALGILMVVMVSLLPQLIVGIRSTSTARQVTQSKGIAQGELERMRSLPFHVSFEASNAAVDVLDRYFPSVTPPTTTPVCTSGSGFAPPQAGWAGYVAPGGTRCSYEPASGAFYRTVRQVPASHGTGAFTVVVSTRFLTDDTPAVPVTPRTDYTTGAGGRPASLQIGANVTVLYTDRASLRPTTTYTQIASQPAADTRLRAEASTTALEVGTVLATNGPTSTAAGQLNLTGSLTTSSTVAGNLSGTSAGQTTGLTASGARTAVAAPPSSPGGVLLVGPGSLAPPSCAVACWGSTRVDVPAVSAVQGLPQAGNQSAPGQALVTDLANRGVSFDNAPVADYRPALKLAPPLVSLDTGATAQPSGIAAGCAPGTSGTASYVAGSGYLRSTAVDAAVEPGTVEACAVARTSTVSLFPTEFAPRGVVQVELQRAAARCRVTGSSHVASTAFDYAAVVRYWDGAAYQEAGTVSSASGSDPLDGLPLATTSVGGGRVLGDYIASWSALTAPEVSVTAGAGEASVKLPGVVTIASQPVRPDATVATDPDPTSVVSLTLGAVSCRALDDR